MKVSAMLGDLTNNKLLFFYYNILVLAKSVFKGPSLSLDASLGTLANVLGC